MHAPICRPHNADREFGPYAYHCVCCGVQVVHDCTSRLDLDIDIKMPSASPNVTMAVPP